MAPYINPVVGPNRLSPKGLLAPIDLNRNHIRWLDSWIMVLNQTKIILVTFDFYCNMSLVMRKSTFCIDSKTKSQISFAITDQRLVFTA